MNKTIDGQVYATRAKMSVGDQFAVARRLGPTVPVLQGLLDKENLDKERSLLTVLMFSHISDDATEFVKSKCLNLVDRSDVTGKMAPLTDGKGNLMFHDVSLPAMLELVIAVIDENLGDFFRTALVSLAEQAQAKT
jgi:hypothetical protein